MVWTAAKSIPAASDLGRRLERLRAGGGLPAPVGQAGFLLPCLNRPRVVLPVLKPKRWTRSNWLVLADGCDQRDLFERIVVDHGRTGNLVIAGERCCMPARIHFKGNNGLVILGEHCTWFADLNIRLSSDDELLFWGARASSNGTSIVISGERRSVIVGEDCMFAADTNVRTSDLHSIISVEDGSWLNEPQDVLLEPHVWIGQEAMVLKGARIGAGSIVGAKALVNGEVPRFSVAAGLPARVIKTGVTWDRPTQPQADTLDRVLALTGRP